jgi:adenylate cyclase
MSTTPPLSVRDRLLLDAEIEAERTVSLIRVAMAVGLALLIAATVAGMGLPSEVIRTQVAAAYAILAVYLGLGLVAWRLARPGRLRPWMPWVFTTGDGALLLFNIAFNAENLGVSMAFATVFPVVWLAPLTVSFTVLRYRPGLQAYSGALLVLGMAALGWSHGAAPVGPLPPAASFALPPNLMRLAMFAGCVAVLVLAAKRRRDLLTRAVDETARRAEYQRYLPPPVADLVARGEIDRLRRGWRAEAAMLMVDIRGFTGLSETLDPAALGRFVTAYRRRLGEVVEAHGGMVDKFVGDGAVVLFGVPQPRATAAADALACARALVAALAEIEGRPLRLAIGAHWGEVIVGAVGDEARLEFTALGDAVNVAARLEEVAKAEDVPVVASAPLLAAADVAAADWRPLARRQVRGRRGALALFAPAREPAATSVAVDRSSGDEA